MTRLPPLDPAVAATRVAVRGELAALSTSYGYIGGMQSAADQLPHLVLVALSGGADSLALAAAVAFEAPKAGVRAGAVVVDHDLQRGSAQVADRAAAQARELGLDPVVVRRVAVSEGAEGPEAAARDARYLALQQVQVELGAHLIFTAHTRDDQAEQVLLALARGSGTRAIAGIPPRRGGLVRPFLDVSRATTEAACRAQGLEFWVDPHNADPTYTRVRVRERVIPALEAELGPGISANLARTAEIAREDADALDRLASEALGDLLITQQPGTGRFESLVLPVEGLSRLPEALRQRVIRLAARALGPLHLHREHTLAIAALVTDWRGQGPIDVPGIVAHRTGDQIVLALRQSKQAE